MRTILCALLVSLIMGCSGPTNIYDITVRNDLAQPITVWLTKNGPPAESIWLSPEQIASGEAPRGERIAGRAVPPGKVAETGAVKGHFPTGTDAILRIYLGQHTLDELLAMSHRDSERLDVTLTPGKSTLIVHEQNGKLVADPTSSKL